MALCMKVRSGYNSGVKYRKSLIVLLGTVLSVNLASSQVRLTPTDSLGAYSEMTGMNRNPLPDYVHGETTGEINTTRLWIVGGTMVLVDVGVMWYYFETFYSPRESERSKWHTFNDWYNSDLNVDKLGHVWGSQAYTNSLYHIFRWTNMSEASSMWWSSGVSLFLQAQMEMTDAFYRRWGWSWWDTGANTLGAVWPNLQRVWEPLQSINLKMSYWPSRAMKNGWVDYVLKDYDGFTYWLAFTVEDFLPQSLKPYWPDWLGVAVGFGADRTFIGKNAYNTDRNNKGLGDQEWYIALDYDLRKLPGDTPFLRFLKEQLNLIHWPSPAIRFTPTSIYYGLYF